ncbi:MAG TPA: hypothetical protein VGL77_13875 [Armatimonadota bacterium]|jgi:hypothetical protein
MMKRIMVLVLAIVVLGGLLVAGCAGKKGTTGGSNAGASATATADSGSGGGGRAQMAAFRESHKYTFEVSRMTGNIARLEKMGIAPLSSEQAKQILTVLQPLRTQPSMTQDQAKATIAALKQVLTDQQLTEIGKLKAPGRGGSGGGARGGSGGPGNGARGGNRSRFDPATMQNFNPFNPPKDSPMAQRGKNRMDELFTMLENKAGGK